MYSAILETISSGTLELTMSKALFMIKALPFLAASAFAVDYPTIPDDLTTPVQQRLAVYGPNCKFFTTFDIK